LYGGKELMDQQEFMLTMEEKSNYLHVCTSGIRSRETVKTITIKVFNTALEKHLSKVLIDVRELLGDFGYGDIFYLVREVLKDLRGKGVDQVAVIDIHRTTRQDWFLEPVAHSYGLNIRVFNEEESALKWLGE
jgi:phosphoribosylpyrophosphate synthetase